MSSGGKKGEVSQLGPCCCKQARRRRHGAALAPLLRARNGSTRRLLAWLWALCTLRLCLLCMRVATWWCLVVSRKGAEPWWF